MTQRLLWPLTRLGETFDLYQRAMASSTRVLDVLDAPIVLKQGTIEPERSTVASSPLVLDDVAFAYSDRDALFDGFSLTFEAGKTTGVVGSTGAGKTTLIRLLLRFAEPNRGRVVWCDEPLAEWRLQALRSSIALVDQHITLFPTSILENIRYGRPEATDEEVVKAAEVAEAAAFVESLPSGWDTLVGEGGHRLSGGQRQRVAIARAVLKDAPLLVLDEATSAVDNETEAALQRSIQRISKGRTTIVIAHRLSTVRHADRIVVLDQGAIAEDGAHETLIQQDGIYAKLWAVQTGSAGNR